MQGFQGLINLLKLGMDYYGSILVMLVGPREEFKEKTFYLRRITGSLFILVVSLHQHNTVVCHMLPPMHSSSVSQEEFNIFHSIDRELYTILAVNLRRDPGESRQVMALWLWLERFFKNVVHKILSLPHILINELADEAVTCLNCINNEHFACSSENYDIPLLQNVLDKQSLLDKKSGLDEEICLRFFHDIRLKAAQGIAKIDKDVCRRAFTDIVQQPIKRNAAYSSADSQKMMAPSSPQPLVQLGFPQMRFHPSDVLQSWIRENGVPPDDRTMFVTFSKGYPVQEKEVREFFTRAFGDCIESLHMQDVQSSEQSLFARIVFRLPSTLDTILNGARKVKFTINGKHVWARKFVPKRQNLADAISATPSASVVRLQ